MNKLQRQFLLGLSLLVGAGLWVGPVHAGIMVSIQQPSAGAGADGLDSLLDSLGGGVVRADSFVVTQPLTVTSVAWWGGYDPEPAPLSDNFVLRLFDDAGGLPAASPLLELGMLTPGRTDTGVQDIFGATIYRYDQALVAGPMLAAGTYWLSVFAVSDDYIWYWTQGVGGDGSSAAQETGFPWEGSDAFGPDMDLAFVINGEVAATAAAPLPGSLILTLPLLAVLKRWRRA